MRAEEFFKIIDGIDDDIILDVPDAKTERPTKVVIEHKKTPIWTIALLTACFVLVLVMGVFVAAKLQANKIITSEDPGNSDSSSVSDNSDSSDSSNSVPDEDEYVLDKKVLDNVRLINPMYEQPEYVFSTTVEELLSVYSLDFDLSIKGIYAVDTGVVIRARSDSYDHYFRLDKNNVEVDHVAFNISDQKELIPNRDYPEGGYFKTTNEDGTTELRYYQNGKLISTAPLPEAHRASLTSDNKQYLYIDPERKDLVLYDLETGAVIRSLSVKDLGYDDPWTFDFVNAVTPKLATVTLLEADPNKASEYNGDENLHSCLLELPSLRVIQQLPDSTELTAIDDENFIMTKRKNSTQRIVSIAKFTNGELVEREYQYSIDEVSQIDHSSNIILSPSKKFVLVRFRSSDNYWLNCRVYTTDELQPVWEQTLKCGGTIPSDFYTPAALTDDAVLYMFGDTLTDGDAQPLYIMYKENTPTEDEPDGHITGADSDTEEYPYPVINMGHGTQAELDRFREILRSPEVYRINGYIAHEDGIINTIDRKAQDIVDFLLNAPISLFAPDEFENPSTGGSESVRGYDKDGNFLFEVTDIGIYIITFQDGTCYDFRFNGTKGSNGELYSHLK